MNRAEIIKAAERLYNFWCDGTPMEQEHAKLIKSLIALVPKDGYVVVPEEPTELMRKAFNDVVEGKSAFWEFRDGYDAMLKTAKEK